MNKFNRSPDSPLFREHSSEKKSSSESNGPCETQDKSAKENGNILEQILSDMAWYG